MKTSNGAHKRYVQVNVDISASRNRFAGLDDKILEVGVKEDHQVKCYHRGPNKWLDRKNVNPVNEEIREAQLTWRFVSTSGSLRAGTFTDGSSLGSSHSAPL